MTDHTGKQQWLKQQLENLRLAYAQELPSKIAALKSEWRIVQTQPSGHTLNNLIHKTHSLRGSGATFGFPALSEAAHHLETALRTTSDFQSETANQTFEALFAELDAAMHQPAIEEPEAALPLAKNRLCERNCPLVLLIGGDDAISIGNLSRQLTNCGILSEVVESAQDLAARLDATAPDAILLNMSAFADQRNELKVIKQINTELRYPPALIVVSELDDMASRLSAVRAGAKAYFPNPALINDLADFIRSRYRRSIESAYRVLIVDDDAQYAHHTALILQRAGMETSIVTDPMIVLESLSIFQPELILLDLYMPECSGLELATVIRQQCAYTGTGIVFFSVETDIDRHIDALREGGDEFFVKDMNPKRLVAAVEARAKRSRIIQQLMLHDGLTGLMNRIGFDEYLQREFLKNKRQSHCFSYVMLDLDHFKRINDQFGHHAGDSVLKALGILLGQRLRAIDIAGRYGGEEIALILSETNAVQAKGVTDELRETFSAMQFSANGCQFSVTFSAGIAEYPYYPSIAELSEAADQALYQAKAEGRNRICIARQSFEC